MKELKIAIDKFKNLNILNSSLSFDEFSRYINSKKVLDIIEKILNLLDNRINKRIFLSGWFLLKYHLEVFTNKIELEKLIIDKIINISKIIVNNNIKTKENIDEINNLINDYEKQFEPSRS